jgi:hypothetical protein
MNICLSNDSCPSDVVDGVSGCRVFLTQSISKLIIPNAVRAADRIDGMECGLKNP